jgi:hypothetical protein
VTRRAAALLFVALTPACGGVDEELSYAWSGTFKDETLAGSTAFRAEGDGSDDGVFYFSYKPPDDDPVAALEALGQQMTARRPCMDVLQASESELWLRCSAPDHPKWAAPRCEEVRSLWGQASRRLFVMCIHDVADVGDHYVYFLISLRYVAGA